MANDKSDSSSESQQDQTGGQQTTTSTEPSIFDIPDPNTQILERGTGRGGTGNFEKREK